MALFTDGLVCDSESLREYESSILNVARTEEIELRPKLEIAQREIALEIITFLQRNGPQYLTGSCELTRVVVTEGLRQWHAAQSLAAIYRDAYHHHLNDRFKEKWAQYSLLTQAAKERYLDGGVAICSRPVIQAALPVLEKRPGGTLGKRTYIVAAAWQADGITGSLSEAKAVDLESGERLSAKVADPPPDIQRWWLFAGYDERNLHRQNCEPLDTNSVWTEDVTGLNSTSLPALPVQEPDLFVRATNILGRG